MFVDAKYVVIFQGKTVDAFPKAWPCARDEIKVSKNTMFFKDFFGKYQKTQCFFNVFLRKYQKTQCFSMIFSDFAGRFFFLRVFFFFLAGCARDGGGGWRARARTRANSRANSRELPRRAEMRKRYFFE